MTDETRETLYEFMLHDADGTFLCRLACVPPFHPAPEIAISGTRYFVLMDDLTYHEAAGVHWLPSIEEVAHADPKPKAG